MECTEGRRLGLPFLPDPGVISYMACSLGTKREKMQQAERKEYGGEAAAKAKPEGRAIHINAGRRGCGAGRVVGGAA